VLRELQPALVKARGGGQVAVLQAEEARPDQQTQACGWLRIREIGNAVQPAAALFEVSAERPELPQRGSELLSLGRALMLEVPGEGGAKVVVLAIQPPHPVVRAQVAVGRRLVAGGRQDAGTPARASCRKYSACRWRSSSTRPWSRNRSAAYCRIGSRNR
jgi:hypothetical protein